MVGLNSTSQSNCAQIDIEDAVEMADVIVAGRIAKILEYPDRKLYVLSISEQFKRENILPTSANRCSIEIRNDWKNQVVFEKGEFYLIYGIKSNKYWVKTDCTLRSRKLKSAQDDLIYLRDNTLCIDESKPKITGPCDRNLSYVCGCDGNNYSNACAAESNGISWWRPGKCE